jgi:hypothetical protein
MLFGKPVDATPDFGMREHRNQLRIICTAHAKLGAAAAAVSRDVVSRVDIFSYLCLYEWALLTYRKHPKDGVDVVLGGESIRALALRTPQPTQVFRRPFKPPASGEGISFAAQPSSASR